MIKKAIIVLLYAVFASNSFALEQNNNWGSVTVSKDEYERWVTIMENSALRCRYNWKPINADKGGESFITELLIKSIDQNQAAASIDTGRGRIDACAGRYQMTEAAIVYDGADRKTVRLKWHHNDAKLTPTQEVMIFSDAPIIKIDYLTFGVNIVDIANPGGGENPKYHFYGGDQWKRDYLLYPKGYYYPPSDTHVVRMTGMPGDEGPGPLDYHGHFIMCVFNAKTGAGYGWLSPVEAITIIKLLSNRVLSFFLTIGRRNKSTPDIYSPSPKELKKQWTSAKRLSMVNDLCDSCSIRCLHKNGRLPKENLKSKICDPKSRGGVTWQRSENSA